jgi:NAD(P)-dependent dehydrogenase (short-subunit alcohol dehydrogenase family)
MKIDLSRKTGPLSRAPRPVSASPSPKANGFTKTANLAISRGLAKRVAGTGVTVNAVLPGPTLTEGVEAMLKKTAEKAGQSIEEAAVAFVKAAHTELDHPAGRNAR